jgi:hypothetical protein
VKTALLVFVLSCCIACSSNKANQRMKISVQMDVFSGRPNPSWELSPSESGELLKQLSLLTEADSTNAVFNDGLGYRGFIISVNGADTAIAVPAVYRVYKGFVLMNGRVYSDSSSVEKQLIKQAGNKGFQDLIEAMRLK